jgi:mannose-6-phosphate isomerase-like protein (cupin superfamily)
MAHTVMAESPRYTRYVFQGHSGCLIAPDPAARGFVTVRHSAGVAPWIDKDLHLHRASEEYYLLLRGQLRFHVAGSAVTLMPGEMLMLRPNVPHAIVHGEGLIEHFGFRAPSPDDRESLGPLPADPLPVADDDSREIRREWGYRIPLHDTRNHNCWVVGLGAARFHSPHFLFAWLDFATDAAANAGLGTRHRLHLHRESWEYYVVLNGAKTLQIEDEVVTIRSGQMLEVAPGVKHTLRSRQAPYRGFTFRVPLRDDKEEYC